MAKPSLHAFTFDDQIFSGPVTNADLRHPPAVVFHYTYSFQGTAFSGTFTGEADGNGTVRGSWSEKSAAPVNGKSAWSGTATLVASEEGGRVVLHGTWQRPKDERWVVDIAK